MTLLVQKEVADRIVARDKKESILSPLFDFFFMPLIQIGRRLTLTISQLNIFLIIFDFIIVLNPVSDINKLKEFVYGRMNAYAQVKDSIKFDDAIFKILLLLYLHCQCYILQQLN